MIKAYGRKVRTDMEKNLRLAYAGVDTQYGAHGMVHGTTMQTTVPNHALDSRQHPEQIPGLGDDQEMDYDMMDDV